MIFSKVAVCTSQSVAFNEHWALMDVWQASETSLRKSRPVNFLAVVLWYLGSLLMELSIAHEKVLCHSVCMCQVFANPVTYIQLNGKPTQLLHCICTYLKLSNINDAQILVILVSTVFPHLIPHLWCGTIWIQTLLI